MRDSNLKIAVRPIRLVAFANAPIHYRSSLYRRVAEYDDVRLSVIYGGKGGPLAPAFDSSSAGYGPVYIEGVESWFVRRANENISDGSFLAFRDIDILSLLKNLAPDVLWLHGYNSLTHQLAAYYSKARGTRLLIREEMNLNEPRSQWKSFAKQVGLRALFRNAHGLYIGSENKKWFKYYGVPDERLHFSPYAVDNDHIRKAALALAPHRQEIRAGFGISDPTTPLIVTVCRLVEKKNVSTLIAAFHRLRERGDAALLIVGSGPLELQLRQQVASSGIQKVHFAGFLAQNEIAQAYVAADIFVLPSAFDETWGLVVNEAMNYGLPVVVSDRVGSSADLVKHEVNGFLFPPLDTLALASALEQLMTSAELRAQYGSKSREIISTWSHDVAAAGVLEAANASMFGR